MKKIISMGVASAVLALTAVVASADIEAGVKAEVNGEATFATGSTVVYNIVAVGDKVENTQLYWEATGLEFEKAEGNKGFMAMPNAAENFLVLANGTAAADGDVIGTLTFKVSAEEGGDVKFALKGDPNFPSTPVDIAVVTDEKAVAPTESSEPTSSEPTSSEPVSDNSDENNSGNESGDNSSNSNGTVPNPGTGIALAVVPAVIAGAAVVVAAKKRK